MMKRKWKNTGQRLLSGALALLLLCSVLLEPAAALARQNEEPIALSASRLADVPEGNWVYFGTASAELEESDRVYTVPVYREGDVSQEVSVELRTIDMTAVYGEDYELVMSDVNKTGSGTTVLEDYMTSALEAEAAAQTEAEEAAALDAVTESTEYLLAPLARLQEEPDDAPARSAVSALAQQKEEATGQPTRQTYETEGQDLLTALVGSLVPEAVAEVAYSGSVILTFKPGQTEQWITFRLRDDSASEGGENFSLLLLNGVGVEPYTVTSMAVSILDDEPLVHAQVGFTSARYDSQSGIATVVVERTGADYSLADMRIYTSQDTALADVNYEPMDETLTFLPYEMKKEIEFYVGGAGSFTVSLSDFTGCTAGPITKTKVHISQQDSAPLVTAAEEDELSFSITVDGRSYIVYYVKGAATGRIMDESYTPAVEVGTYYFALPTTAGGLFSYSTSQRSGDKPLKIGTLDCYYVDTGTQHTSYGDVAYYHTYTARTGEVHTVTENKPIPGVWYQFISADWASTNDFGGGQKFWLQIPGLELKSTTGGTFGRTQDNTVIKLANINSVTNNRYINLSAHAVDDNKNRTPKSYLRFYGAVAMYKKYEVSVSDPGSLKFRTGTGAMIEADPVQIKLRCGLQDEALVTTDLKRINYVNMDEDKSNVVFNLDNSAVNGMHGKFAKVTGYTITIEPGDDKDSNGATIDNTVTLNYPEDFIAYIQRRVTTQTGDPAVEKYNSSAVANEVEKINQDLSTVPFDEYFIDWIDFNQKKVVNSGSGYKQNLIFKPKYAYIDVPVRVLEPRNGEAASFTDSQLCAIGTYTYHAGDVLDLSAVCSANGYRVTGYEVSTNKGQSWNAIRDTDMLKLEPNVGSGGYYIRPLVEKNDNCIEIKFASEEARKVNVLGAEYGGFVSEELLGELDMDGSLILRLGDGETALEQMRPMTGAIYSIYFQPYTEGDTVCYPVITDAYGNSYATTLLHYTARDSAKDNVLTVDYIKGSGPKTYEITGRLVSDYAPIRATGTENQHLGVGGYTVSMPRGETADDGRPMIEAASDISGDDGSFTLTGVKGVSGMPMTMLVSNGSDEQVITVTPGSGGGLDVGEISMDYPINAPVVYDLSYKYGKEKNNMEEDNTQNSVKVYDDDFLLTVLVDDRGHDVVEAEFTLYTVTGQEKVYEVPANENTPGVFTCTVAPMTQYLYNGSRIRVTLVTKQTVTGTNAATGETETMEIERRFPARDTGLVFYVESTVIIPKTIETTETPTMEIPFLGGMNSSATSGILNFQKYYWDEETKGNYSLVVNLNAVLYQTRTNGTEDTFNEMKEVKEAAGQMEYDIFEFFEFTGYQDGVGLNRYISELRRERAMLSWHPRNQEYRNMKALADNFDEIVGNNNKATSAVRKHYAASFTETMSGFNSSKALQAQVLCTLMFNFTLDPEQNAYVFTTGSICIGATVTFKKTWYTLVYGVPIYLNLDGHVSADTTLLYRTAKSDGAMTAEMFDQISGNLVGQLSADEKAQVNLELGGKVKVSVGVGLSGVLGAKGSLALEMMFHVPLSEDIASEYGVLVVGTGSIGVDLLVTTLEVELVNAAFGAGIYKDKTQVSFLDGLLEPELKGSGSGTNAAGGGAQTLTVRDYTAGTMDMSDFGSNHLIQATPGEIDRTILLDDAAERTAPQILELDDGRKLVFFIGNRGGATALNSRALFYAVYEDGLWSEPVMVADDGTADASPVAVERNGRVVLAWVDADRPFTESDTSKDKLNTLGISVAVYEDGVMGREITLVEDEFFNFAPQLNLVDDTLYCSYMKRDISTVTKDEDLLDFTGLYSTMAYVEIDVPTRTKTEEGFIVVEHPVLTDPLVMDYHCLATRVGGEDYMVATYTVDEDLNLSTSADRELFLSITNLTTGQTYYPIALTADQVDQANPRLTDLDGNLYLTWFEYGYLFNMMDVTELLEAFFNTEEVGDTYRGDTAPGWYRKSAQELPGLLPGDGNGAGEEPDGLYYDGTVYDLANRGQFRHEQANFQASEDVNTSVSEYVLTTDGDDIYIFYTDFGNDSLIDLSMELYGVRYQRDMSDDGRNEAWGFGKAVKITDFGRVIDEFDLYMTEDSRISMVSNHYKSWIDGEGLVRKDANQLVEIEFVPASSLSVADEWVTLPGSLVGGNTGAVSFEVINEGLQTATGYDVTLTQIRGGIRTEVYTGSDENALDSGESRQVVIPWTIPDDLSDVQLEVTVTEHDVQLSRPAEVLVEVPYETVLEVSDSAAEWVDGQVVYTATVTNLGNKPSESAAVRFGSLKESRMDRLAGEAVLPALASGESTQVSFTFDPLPSDFNDVGCLSLRLEMEQDGQFRSLDAAPVYPGKPVAAAINEGARSVTVAPGKTAALRVEVGPWDGIAGNVRWSSSDPAVASVDENGTVTGGSSGTAVITACYDSGVRDTITVRVADTAEPVFTDVEPGSFYADAVAWAVEEGITLGTSATTFDPNGVCNRAQAVTFLWRAAGAPAPEGREMPFADVKPGTFYYDAVLWALEQGITNGTSATTFGPNDPCTRAQIILLLWRAENSPAAEASAKFCDVDPESGYAEAVWWAVAEGITQGTTDVTFSPNLNCNRAQIVTFLWRVHQR